MKKQRIISGGVFLIWAGLLTLVLHGCGSDTLDRRPCAETVVTRPSLSVNLCPNVTPGEWSSLGLETERVSAIAVHPDNPGIIYAGTQRNFSEGVRGKLFRSTDCGQSWDTLAVGGSYRTIQFSPGNPDVIYAVNGGILKSINAGQSWQQADEGFHIDAETGVSALAINPKNACTLYAGTAGFYGGDLYKSTDAGASWGLIEGKGLERNQLSGNITSLAIDPNNPEHIYAGTGALGDVLRSTNGGDTWETTELVNTGSLVHALLIHPENSRKMYAGLDGLHISQNSGKNWELIVNEFLTDTTSVVELEMDNQNRVLYVVTTYGDSGSLFAYNTSSGVWKESLIPVTDKSFYYSKLKVYEFEGKVYTYFGLPSGIYIRIDE